MISKSIDTVLNNVERTDDGRLVVPILWNEKNSHMLAKNFKLAKNILLSNLKKYKNDHEKLLMIDDVFKFQEGEGIIERVDNVDQFLLDKPHCSFFAHF